MFFKFPYTDMYTVNLDWIITKIKEFENFVGQTGSLVFTVNGKAGDVIITKEDITDIVGGIVNSINGKSGDIVMSPEDIRALVGDYVVRFNNRVGDVTLRADDITATRINVVWVSDSGDVIEDLTPEDLAEMYNSGKRILLFYNSAGIPDRVYFLTLENDIPTPILYSPAELDTGVVSVNGLTGIVSIYSTDIKMTSDAGSRTIAQEVEALKQRDILHSEAILALQDSDSTQDTQIAALQTASTSHGQDITAQGNAITALQAKDTTHDSQILALQGDVSDLENVFTGATETTSGAKGLVPAPTNTQITQYLKATGNFESVSAGEVTSAAVSGAGTVEAALMAMSTKLDELNNNIVYTSPSTIISGGSFSRFKCIYNPAKKLVFIEGHFYCTPAMATNSVPFTIPDGVPSPYPSDAHYDFRLFAIDGKNYGCFLAGREVVLWGATPANLDVVFGCMYICQ